MLHFLGARIYPPDVSVLIEVGDYDRAHTVVDALDLSDEHAFRFVLVPLNGACLDDGVHFFGLVQLEIEGALGLHDIAVLVDVRLLILGVGVVGVKQQPDDHGHRHPAGGGVKDEAVVIGEVAVVFEAGVVVGVKFRDAGFRHPAVVQDVLVGVYDGVRDGESHSDTRGVAEPRSVGRKHRILDIRHNILLIDEVIELGIMLASSVFEEDFAEHFRPLVSIISDLLLIIGSVPGGSRFQVVGNA